MMTPQCWAWLAALTDDHAEMTDMLALMTKREVYELALACERLGYLASEELERRNVKEAGHALLPGA